MDTYKSQRHPDLHYYTPELCRSKAERDELEEWHEQVSDKPFNFMEQVSKYCIQVTEGTSAFM